MSTFDRLNCSICFDWLNNTKSTCVTNCSHVFHEECLNKWLSQKATCPLCSRTVSNAQRMIFSSAPFDQSQLQEELNVAYKRIEELEKKAPRRVPAGQQEADFEEFVFDEEEEDFAESFIENQGHADARTAQPRAFFPIYYQPVRYLYVYPQYVYPQYVYPQYVYPHYGFAQ
ncbi:hypothetical protein QR680_006374 [Steinernema hermaphroditum]|uniref:RING-type domain-containing protein n=1 Tax=Steinernema hermaphroditum TaxID=289476 RepID=A0AA39LXB1_9BILA|nr:hypothetical protein QR680_006374 [Steinernema hermaphroditum]